MVLLEQISALLDYLEGNPELAHGYCSRTTEGRSLAKRRWGVCAQILNSVAAGCPTKSPVEWRTFYNEYKCKLLKKIKLQKRQMSDTGGGPAKKIELTPLQKRLYGILERDIGEPLPDVHDNSFSQFEPAMNIVAVDSASTASDFPLECESKVADNSPQAAPPSKPRRRRIHSTRCYPAQDRAHSALAASQARLEQIEARNAAATLAQARATENLAAAINRLGESTFEANNRLAAAIDKIGDMIGLFVANPPKTETFQNHRSESDTE